MSFRTTKGSSTIPVMQLDKESLKLMDDMKRKWPKRLEEARVFFLLDVAKYMLKAVQEHNVSIDSGGEPWKYADDLMLGVLDSGEGQDVVAIYLDGATAKITNESAENTVIYFQVHRGSPEWVNVLREFSPWPAHMIPVKVKTSDAKAISRIARQDEIRELSRRIFMHKNVIESSFAKAGIRGVHIGSTDYGIGLSTHEDLGYNVLRREFGMDGYKKEAHWRPAFAKTKKYAEQCMEKVVVYVTTGKNVFDLPENADRIGTDVIKEGSGFEKKIVPFMKTFGIIPADLVSIFKNSSSLNVNVRSSMLSRL